MAEPYTPLVADPNMKLPPCSMRSFLAEARRHLRNAPRTTQHLTLVIGNESADLDSLVSPILFSYILSRTKHLHIPISHLRRDALRLRPEVLSLLPLSSLTPEHLITLDELPSPTELPADRTSWILLDHNKFTGPLAKHYSSKVVGCIDHHADEGAVARTAAAEPRVIERAGSCSSLVTAWLKPHWDCLTLQAIESTPAIGQLGDMRNILEDANLARLWDAQAALLGAAAVLVDTANLRSAEKTTDKDRAALEALEIRISLGRGPWLGVDWDREGFWRMVEGWKGDLGGLTVREVLEKDYKEWEEGEVRLGVASVVKKVEWLVEKAGTDRENGKGDGVFLEELKGFAEEKGLDVVVVMTTSNEDGRFQRELLVWALNEKGVKMAKKFATDAAEELKLEEWSAPFGKLDDEGQNGQWRKAWWQRNTACSRKQVAPLLRQAAL